MCSCIRTKLVSIKNFLNIDLLNSLRDIMKEILFNTSKSLLGLLIVIITEFDM